MPYIIIAIEGEEYKIPMDVPKDYTSEWEIEYEESGFDYNQAILGLDAQEVYMPYDEEDRFWVAKRDGVFMDKGTCYKPPPDYEDDPPPPMGASQRAIDKWDEKHKVGG